MERIKKVSFLINNSGFFSIKSSVDDLIWSSVWRRVKNSVIVLVRDFVWESVRENIRSGNGKD